MEARSDTIGIIRLLGMLCVAIAGPASGSPAEADPVTTHSQDLR